MQPLLERQLHGSDEYQLPVQQPILHGDRRAYHRRLGPGGRRAKHPLGSDWPERHGGDLQPGHWLLRRVPRLLGFHLPSRRTQHRPRHRDDLRGGDVQYVRVLIHAMDERHCPREQPVERVLLHPQRQAHRLLQRDCVRPRARYRDGPHNALRGQRHNPQLDIRPRSPFGAATRGQQRNGMGDSDGEPDPADFPAPSHQRRRDDTGKLRLHHQRANSKHLLRQRDLHHSEGRSGRHSPHHSRRRGRQLRDQLDLLPAGNVLQYHERSLRGDPAACHQSDHLHGLGQ